MNTKELELRYEKGLQAVNPLSVLMGGVSDKLVTFKLLLLVASLYQGVSLTKLIGLVQRLISEIGLDELLKAPPASFPKLQKLVYAYFEGKPWILGQPFAGIVSSVSVYCNGLNELPASPEKLLKEIETEVFWMGLNSELKNKIRFLVYMSGMPATIKNQEKDSAVIGYGLGIFDRPVFKDGLLPFTCGSLELLRESGVEAAGKRGKELMLAYNKGLQVLPGDARYWPHILMTEAVS